MTAPEGQRMFLSDAPALRSKAGPLCYVLGVGLVLSVVTGVVIGLFYS
jgi:hypothetical protein